MKANHSHHSPKSHYRHSTYEMAEDIRRLYFSRTHKQAKLAAMFNLRQNTISRIISRQTCDLPYKAAR